MTILRISVVRANRLPGLKKQDLKNKQPHRYHSEAQRRRSLGGGAGES